MNESSFDAIEREVTEELGDGFHVELPIVPAENFFNFDGVSFHEICTFYLVRVSEVREPTGVPGMGESFCWVERTKASSLVIKPTFIREHLFTVPANLHHVVHRD